MRTRTPLTISLLTGLFLITSCTGSVDIGPTSTTDPEMLDINERAIWDLENLREEVNDLAEVAADTPVEDLEPIVRQMTALKEEIEA